MPCHIRNSKDLMVDILIDQVNGSLIIERDIPRILLSRALCAKLHNNGLECFSELQWCWVFLLTGRYTPRQPTLIGKNSNVFSCFPQFLKLLKTPWHDLPIIDMLWKRLATFCFSKRPVQVECVQKIVFSNFISWHRFLLALLLVVEVQLCAL